MKRRSHILPAVLGLSAAAALVWAAVFLDGQIPDSAGGLMFGLAGALAGVCATALALELADARRTPEQRWEAARNEADERNAAIREKAALSSWYCTLAVLGAAWALALFWGEGRYLALSTTAVVLHSVLYLVNIGRWARKM